MAPSPTALGTRAPRWALAGVAAALAFTFALSVAYLFRRAPWWDEGLYGDVARRFATRGTFGSPLLGASGNFGFAVIPRADTHTYWTTPLYPFVVGLWFRIAGVGLLQMRVLSLVCSAVLVAAWGSAVRRLTGSVLVAVIAMGLIAVNSHVLWSASIGRPEALGSALAAVALAAYLRWRERHLMRAVCVASALVAAGALAHPLVAVEAVALAAIALVLDARRLRPGHVLAACGVGALVLLPWGLYILQAPDIFRAQWAANTGTKTGSRLAGLTNPFGALASDFRERYLFHHFLGVSGGARVLVVELVALGAAVVLALAWPRVRRIRGFVPLALAALASFATLAVLDGSRYQQYFVHVYPALLAFAALAVATLVVSGRGARLAAAALVVGLAVPGLGGVANRVAVSPYDRQYTPVAAAVRHHLARGERVTGGSELAFTVGFGARLVDDMELRTPTTVYVQNEMFKYFTRGKAVRARLHRDYQVTLRTDRYTVFVRKAPVVADTVRVDTIRAATVRASPSARAPVAIR